MDGAEWLRTELTSFGCAGCGTAFHPDAIRVLAEREGLFFVDLGCSACGSQAVAIVTIEDGEGSGPTADVGDLATLVASSEGASAVAPVSADDVLEMHELLAGWQGDVRGLLRHLDGTSSRLP